MNSLIGKKWKKRRKEKEDNVKTFCTCIKYKGM
uniref:Uncharacterized protein n=1 Tax=Rhizophora mucronata TaxID=61149 RepID=A0A2P2N4X7_RHIMU